jgi:hypothetical protein
LLLIILGAWGALIPFIGPYFDFAYTPNHEWTWTAARGWLEVFPGVTTVVGGVMLVGTGNRATAMFGGGLAVFGGAWFVVGDKFATTLGIKDMGQPVASTDAEWGLLEVSYFSGLGALIVFVGGAVLARVSIRHARDVARARAPAADVSGTDVWSTPQYPPAAAESGAEPEPRKSRGGLFRRKRASASR